MKKKLLIVYGFLLLSCCIKMRAKTFESSLEKLNNELVSLKNALSGMRNIESKDFSRFKNYQELRNSLRSFLKKPEAYDLDKNGETFLTAAIKHFSIDLNELSIQYFRDNFRLLLNKKNNAGETPLIIAVRKDQKNIVRWLLQSGADANISDEKGFLPIFYASNGNIKEDLKRELSFTYGSFSVWNDACKNLKLFRDVKSDEGYLRSLDFDATVLLHAFTEYASLENKPFFNEEKFWFNGKKPAKLTSDFRPFVQRLILKSGDKVALHGDWHGDIQSLLTFIQELQKRGFIYNDTFKIKDPNFYILFLGDYVDRGLYSLEVVYTLIRLKYENPEQVILTRGNHEDRSIAARYGLYSEIESTFGTSDQKKIKEAFDKWFNQLPIAAYVGCKGADSITYYVQCNHGGIEVGYDPKPFLAVDSQVKYHFIDKLYREDNIKAIAYQNFKIDGEDTIIKLLGPVLDENNGFMWSDFNLVKSDKFFNNVRGAGIGAGGEATKDFLSFASSNTVKLQGIIRSHQHGRNPVMQRVLNLDGQNTLNWGVAKLWQEESQKNKNRLWPNIVCTFNIAPNTYYGSYFNFANDAWALLEPNALSGAGIESWKMEVFRNE